jgi:hypothetical protein
MKRVIELKIKSHRDFDIAWLEARKRRHYHEHLLVTYGVEIGNACRRRLSFSCGAS